MTTHKSWLQLFPTFRSDVATPLFTPLPKTDLKMQESSHMRSLHTPSPKLSFSSARTAQGAKHVISILFVEASQARFVHRSSRFPPNLTIRHLETRQPSKRTHERLARVLLRVEPWANRFAVTRDPHRHVYSFRLAERCRNDPAARHERRQ